MLSTYQILCYQAGVAAIALGVYEKFGVTVPIVPVGLNYFRGHHFRGRVVVEFGQPIHIKKELIQTYKDSRRCVVDLLFCRSVDNSLKVLKYIISWAFLCVILANNVVAIPFENPAEINFTLSFPACCNYLYFLPSQL